MTRRVLIIEDSGSVAMLLKRDLPPGGYVISSVGHRQALDRAIGMKPDLIVLDLYARPDNTMDICAAIHKAVGVPVIALVTDRKRYDAEVEGVEYHAGGVNFTELAARIHTLLSRPRKARKAKSSHVIAAGDFRLDLEARRVIKGGRSRKLTPKATQLLHAFVTHPKETLTRRWLMKEIWETDYTGDTRTLDVHVHWIRQAIEDDPRSPIYLRTVRGVGYRFEVPGSE